MFKIGCRIPFIFLWSTYMIVWNVFVLRGGTVNKNGCIWFWKIYCYHYLCLIIIYLYSSSTTDTSLDPSSVATLRAKISCAAIASQASRRIMPMYMIALLIMIEQYEDDCDWMCLVKHHPFSSPHACMWSCVAQGGASHPIRFYCGRSWNQDDPFCWEAVMPSYSRDKKIGLLSAFPLRTVSDQMIVPPRLSQRCCAALYPDCCSRHTHRLAAAVRPSCWRHWQC